MIIITIMYNSLTLAYRQITKPNNILGSHVPLWSIIYVGEGKGVPINKAYNKQLNKQI